MDPLLRWAGSKKSTLPELTSLFPPNVTRYLEPFAGSACVFFHIEPKVAVINDSNRAVCDFYEHVVSRPTELFSRFMAIPRTREAYYASRAKFNESGQGITRSALFFYLNRNCFNGIFRTNSKGHFNVPYADRRIAPYPGIEKVLEAASLLRRAKIACLDFEAVCSTEVTAGDFVYLDPPYYVPAVRTFREYSAQPFSEIDFCRLERLLVEIDKRGAKFAMSYPECHSARNLASMWNCSVVRVRRRISGALSSRGYAPELVIRNYN